MANISNSALYGVFTFSALFAGTLLNVLGPRLTMMLGITGYPLYIGAMWYFDLYGNLGYPVFAGAYLGLTGGCLWTTAAYVSNAYAEEKDKGFWRAIQWQMNVWGQVINQVTQGNNTDAIGASVALGVSWNASSASVPHAVYIIFIVIQCTSVALALLLLPAEKIRRADGTALAVFKPISVWESLRISASLFYDWRILLMIPTFFAGEMFFPFQSSMNAYAFNLRTQTLTRRPMEAGANSASRARAPARRWRLR
ncbi:uncharacterized protein BP5553_10644 [Venustampulla echinocandica]|uniref:Uncharacterized protein n=1 Tax=Venustampulla echinocandica TaxID=2656787 RepID=A0A370T960_9HELO|nr:uncharacterized protein BP5553_10644 [Venustampulla echinocandica]RDL30017.1 hypothetical protein BP5553_10644 [Venustampulla echinocandica]